MKKKQILIISSIVLLGLITLIVLNINNKPSKQAENKTPAQVNESVEVAAAETIHPPEPTLEPTPTPEPVIEEEPIEEPEEVIDELTARIEILDKTMYATQSVNLRVGDSADFEKVGGLKRAQTVHVTGQSTETKWYQITQEDGAIVYVSNNFLADNKPVDQTAEPLAGASIADVPEAPIVDYSGEFETGVFDGAGLGTIGGLGDGDGGLGSWADGVTFY